MQQCYPGQNHLALPGLHTREHSGRATAGIHQCHGKDAKGPTSMTRLGVGPLRAGQDMGGSGLTRSGSRVYFH